MTPIPCLDPKSLTFPAPENALIEPDGLLAFGGDLSCIRLNSAYQQGIFPWFSEQDPILWWSPSVRAVLYPHELHIGRTLTRFLKKTDYTVSINYAFNDVIQGCSHNRSGGTWITRKIQQAYSALHQQGYAHSVEVWQHNQLVGGLYGVEQGALFCGESMFSYASFASKVALFAFCLHFIKFGGKLIDCQVLNPHTLSLGAIEISRNNYLTQLKLLQKALLPAACWQPQVIEFKKTTLFY